MEEEKKINCPQTQSKRQGVIYSWGIAQHGCLGNGKNDVEQMIPIPCCNNVKEKFVQVSTGGYFAAALTVSGSVYVWGNGKKGRLGIQSKSEDMLIPQQIQNLPCIIQISCGNWHSLFLDQSNNCYATGHNGYGSLGFNDTNDRSIPELIPELPKIKQIAAGDGFSLFIGFNGELLSCGHRMRHGNKSDQHQLKCVQVKELSQKQIIYASAGFSHACVIDSNGKVYSWGNGEYLQLGHGLPKNEKEPKCIQSLSNINICQVSCSRGEKNCHTGAIDQDGFAYTWGSGYKGKLGHYKEWAHDNPADEPNPKKIEAVKNIKMKKICAGGIHTCLLSEDGRVFSFGCGSDGRLGHPEFANYTYLYREGFPREIDTLKGKTVFDISVSYYHNSCIVE